MKQPDARRNPSIDDLTSDLVKVVRRHDPVWTDANDSDPGVTLLEVQAWIAQELYSYRKVNPGRSDPYRNFKFRVNLDGAVVAGVTRVSALRRTVEVTEYRDGNDPTSVRRLPGRVVYEPFTLERPLDADRSFEDWANLVGSTAPGGPTSYRKSIRIEVVDKGERLLLAYDVLGCWPSEYRVLPELSESLTLVTEGWQRDRSV
jgi:phage tail-like protein